MKPKSNKIQIASFDDTTVIGINSTLIDYKLAWSINNKLSLDLARYDDLIFEGAPFSFFYYNAGENYNVYNLVSLMQLYLFFSYFMGGFAYAGEALGGKAYGAHNKIAFRETLNRLWMWMVIVTAAYTLLYLIGGRWIVGLLTDEAQVIEAAGE